MICKLDTERHDRCGAPLIHLVKTQSLSSGTINTDRIFLFFLIPPRSDNTDSDCQSYGLD